MGGCQKMASWKNKVLGIAAGATIALSAGASQAVEIEY